MDMNCISIYNGCKYNLIYDVIIIYKKQTDHFSRNSLSKTIKLKKHATSPKADRVLGYILFNRMWCKLFHHVGFRRDQQLPVCQIRELQSICL